MNSQAQLSFDAAAGLEAGFGVIEHKVFVDHMMNCIPTAKWRWSEACHLFVKPETPLEVLHHFANRIGLRLAWFQNRRGSMPHYDLNTSRRAAAVKAGAVELDRKAAVEIFRDWRAR